MGLHLTDGTRLSSTDFAAHHQAPPNPDPLREITSEIRESYSYPGEGWPPSGMRLKYNAGDLVRQSEIDALYTAATITGIDPASGPAAGGTAVTITGTDFTVGSTVTFGGNAATNVAVNSAEEITCATPAGTAATTVDVAVTTDAGTVTATGAFSYV